MERQPPIPQFARVGLLNKRVRILEPTVIHDPITGGVVPGPPKVIAELLAGIEPAMLSRLLKEEIVGGAITNTETHHVTFWYVPGVTVSQYVEYPYVEYPGGGPTKIRQFEILEVRQVYEDYRLIELLCKERVPQPA